MSSETEINSDQALFSHTLSLFPEVIIHWLKYSDLQLKPRQVAWNMPYIYLHGKETMSNSTHTHSQPPRYNTYERICHLDTWKKVIYSENTSVIHHLLSCIAHVGPATMPDPWIYSFFPDSLVPGALKKNSFKSPGLWLNKNNIVRRWRIQKRHNLEMIYSLRILSLTWLNY